MPAPLIPIMLGATEGTEPAIVLDRLTVTEWGLAAGILVIGFAISVLAKRGLVSLLQRGTTSSSVAEVIGGRILQTLILTVALLYALSVLGVQLGPLVGALGVGGIAIALALQPTMENLFAGIVLHAQRPLKIGEEVITGDVKGVVIDITSRAVAVQRRSGEIIHIPNSLVLSREIENLVRHGMRRTTLTVGVAYGSDVELAKQVVLDATKGCPAVHQEPEPVVFAQSFADSSVNLEVDYWHGPLDGERREAGSQVVTAIHAALAEAGITIPFPQRTLWWGDGPDTAADG